MPKKKKKAAKKVAAPKPPAAAASVAGRLEVPSGGDFTVEVKVFKDPPVWNVTLVGKNVTGLVGQNESPFSRTISGLPDGYYVLTIEATLVSTAGRFEMVAQSAIDDERKTLVQLPDASTRIDMLPVVVGLEG